MEEREQREDEVQKQQREEREEARRAKTTQSQLEDPVAEKRARTERSESEMETGGGEEAGISQFQSRTRPTSLVGLAFQRSLIFPSTSKLGIWGSFFKTVKLSLLEISK